MSMRRRFAVPNARLTGSRRWTREIHLIENREALFSHACKHAEALSLSFRAKAISFHQFETYEWDIEDYKVVGYFEIMK